MSIRKILLCTCVAMLCNAAPAVARLNFDVDIGVAPPPARVEVVPEPRPGYVWAPGYWGWEDDQHIWVRGRWIEARPGYRWVPEHWEHHGPHWHFAHGYWEHERWEHGHGHWHD